MGDISLSGSGPGATVAVTIIALFLAGILVGGIRIMDPPGWGQFGYMSQLVEKYDRRRQQLEGEYSRVEPSSSEEEANPGSDGDIPAGPALLTEPLNELGDKPWYVGQILCGPLTLAASAVSVNAATSTGPAGGGGGRRASIAFAVVGNRHAVYGRRGDVEFAGDHRFGPSGGPRQTIGTRGKCLRRCLTSCFSIRCRSG